MRVATRLGAALALALLGAARCSATQLTPSRAAETCTGDHIIHTPSGECVPCGAANQPCCPNGQNDAGQPIGDFCWEQGMGCLPPETGPRGMAPNCQPCGHEGERVCAEGCVQGFPQPTSVRGIQRCSCTVPRGMPALPGCPPAASP